MYAIVGDAVITRPPLVLNNAMPVEDETASPPPDRLGDAFEKVLEQEEQNVRHDEFLTGTPTPKCSNRLTRNKRDALGLAASLVKDLQSSREEEKEVRAAEKEEEKVRTDRMLEILERQVKSQEAMTALLMSVLDKM